MTWTNMKDRLAAATYPVHAEVLRGARGFPSEQSAMFKTKYLESLR